MSFHVGQKVVCVDARKFNRIPGYCYPEQDKIYTIRALNKAAGWLGVLLQEIVNPPYAWTYPAQEGPFKLSRFRPVVEKKTDTGMAILRKVADDASNRRELTVCGND